MNDARYMHKASILPSGNVLVMGGIGNRAIALKSAELYDPSIGIWTTTGNMSCTRFGHTASVLANGKVLVAGGSYIGNRLSSVELYDPSTGLWTNTGNMSYARYGHTTSTLTNGKVLVAGGGDFSLLSTAELYSWG
jgi:N-acetylneuraminic acid mutarotase